MRLLEYGAPLKPTDVEVPQVSGRSALVKVEASGVCHTDIHLVAGGYDLGEGKVLSMKERGVRLPMTPGHETAGKVETVGPDGEEMVREGDRVAVYPWIGCGTCRKCVSGAENLCEVRPGSLGIFRDGGYAEYVLVPDVRYLAKIGDLDPVKAAPLTCSGLTAFSSLRRCELMSDDLLVVIGAGGLGTAAIQLAKKVGGARVMAMDVDDSKLELASGLGADYTLNISGKERGEVASRVKEANHGRGADAAIDFVGNPVTASVGFQLLGRGGRLVLVGLFGGAASFPLPLFPQKGAQMIGNFTGTMRDLLELVPLVGRGVVTPVVSGTSALEEANAVLTRLAKGEVKGRVVLRP